MRCNICDKELTEKEVVFNQELGSFEPCTVCLDIALEAAYSGDFAREDELDDKYIIDDLEELSGDQLSMLSFWRGVNDED